METHGLRKKRKKTVTISLPCHCITDRANTNYIIYTYPDAQIKFVVIKQAEAVEGGIKHND